MPHSLVSAWARAALPAIDAPYGLLALSGIFFLAAAVSFALFGPADPLPHVWVANAVAGALLVRLERVRPVQSLAGFLLAGTAAGVLVAGHAMPAAAALACVNVLEVGLTAWLIRRYVRPTLPDAGFAAGVRCYAVYGLLVPLLCAAPAGLVLDWGFGVPFAAGAPAWAMATAIGGLLCTPCIHLAGRKALLRMIAPRHRVENLLLAMASLAVTAAALAYMRFPFAVLAVPLTVAAYRMGAFGGAVVAALSGWLVVGCWLTGLLPGQLITDPGDAADFPVVAFAAALLSPIAVGLSSDDRRRTHAALRFSERRFRESLQHSPAGMAILDMQGRWITSNPALERLLGYDHAELRGIPAVELMHPEDAAERQRQLERLQCGELDAYTAERRYRHKSGAWIWGRVAVWAVRDDEGNALHHVVQLESLEARMRAERDLAEERERLRITLRAIADAVVAIDVDGRITYLNAAAETLLGSSLEAVLGRRIGEVVMLTSERTGRSVPATYLRCLTRGAPVQSAEPCVLHRPDGSVCLVRETATPVLGADKRVNGIVVVLHDVTESSRREREMRHRAAHDALTGLVNRFEFERRAREALQRARHAARSAVLCIIDLDHFKDANDRGGHLAGDEILRHVAQALRSAVRTADVVARLGGDEFAVILDGCSHGHARHIGRKLLRAVSSLRVHWQGELFQVGASIGIARAAPDMQEVAAWLDAADAACYAAKRGGRNRLQIAWEKPAAAERTG